VVALALFPVGVFFSVPFDGVSPLVLPAGNEVLTDCGAPPFAENVENCDAYWEANDPVDGAAGVRAANIDSALEEPPPASVVSALEIIAT
jgi:hypothetical protein